MQKKSLTEGVPELLGLIWSYLKRNRKIPIGPLSLSFKLERTTVITRNTGKRLRISEARHREWESNRPEISNQGHKEQRSESTVNSPTKPELALIVGVGPGFGYALSMRLAAEGMAVILVSRNAKRLDSLVADIIQSGGFACSYGCDATNETAVVDLFSMIDRIHGVPHLVIYSLQYFGPGAVMDTELPAFEDGWKHNCLGPFLVSRSAARLMSPLGRGSIILVGSTSSIIGRAGHLNLAVGKFGQRALAQVLARELWPAGIHVAHMLIDADIREDAHAAHEDSTSDPHQIAESVLSLHRQPRTAWTSEMDIRPWNEKFWEHC